MEETTLVQEEPVHTGSKRPYTRREDQIAALRAEIKAEIKAELVAEFNAIPEDDDPYPLYEIGQGGYFSRDCVNYPAGAVIRDKRGDLIPNQEWLPLNDAARQNMAAYEASLPDKGLLTPKERDDLIPHARIELRNREFGTDEEREAAVLARALYLKRRNASGPDVRGRPDPNVPIMSNVRIQQVQHNDKAAIGHPSARLFGARPTAWPAGSETELYNAPVVAANKPVPVFTSVQSTPLGTVGVE